MGKEGLREVILNGDDYGLTIPVNYGINRAIEEGALTSASVMVDRPAANGANALSGIHEISVGLHLDLATGGAREVLSRYLCVLAWPDRKVREEFERQVERFVDLVGRSPDHIDGHHHAHRWPGIRDVVADFAREHGIPVRGVDATLQMGFYARRLFLFPDPNGATPQRLVSVIDGLPPGIHEFACHPAERVDDGLVATGTTYLGHRVKELNALTSDQVKDFFKRNQGTVRLVSWNEVMQNR